MITPGTRAAAIVNPVAGPAVNRTRNRQSSDLVKRAFADEATACEVVFTKYAGHARELASNFASQGVSPIIAWGGDGTVNEVASALAFQPAVLGIVPTGSGNGLARELGISLDPSGALATAVHGRDRTIDIGVLGGRTFVNLAGVGLDAAVAETFSQVDGRGLRRYVQATMATVFRYEPSTYVLTFRENTWQTSALLVAFANGTQYGHGASIAPHARLDDGLLDLVVIAPRNGLRVLWGARRLFTGTIAQDPDVRTATVDSATIASEQPIRFHVDGEVVCGGRSLTAVTHHAALRVRVPR